MTLPALRQEITIGAPKAGMARHDHGRRGQESESEEEEPENLVCPITHMMYLDPVFVPATGNTYERSALESFWEHAGTTRDPLTNIRLRSTTLHTNWGKRREVQQFLERKPGYVPRGWERAELPPPGGSGRENKRTALWRSLLPLSFRYVRCYLVLAMALAAASTGWAMGEAIIGASDGETPASDQREWQAIKEPPGGTLTGGRMRVQETEEELRLEVPPAGVSGEAIATGSFALAWTAIVLTWTYQVVASGAPLPVAAFSLPFWGISGALARHAVTCSLEQEMLIVNTASKSILLSKRLRGLELRPRTWQGALDDVIGARVATAGRVNGRPKTFFEILEGARRHDIGKHIEWVEQELARRRFVEFLARHGYGRE